MLKNINTRKEEGFTLIELLVVIGIIAVLAGVAFPIFLNQQRSAALASIKYDVKNTSSAVTTYIISHPDADQAELQANVEKILSDNNVISITGSARNFFVCGETMYGDNWAYSNVLGVMDDCTLDQAPPA